MSQGMKQQSEDEKTPTPNLPPPKTDPAEKAVQAPPPSVNFNRLIHQKMADLERQERDRKKEK